MGIKYEDINSQEKALKLENEIKDLMSILGIFECNRDIDYPGVNIKLRVVRGRKRGLVKGQLEFTDGKIDSLYINQSVFKVYVNAECNKVIVGSDLEQANLQSNVWLREVHVQENKLIHDGIDLTYASTNTLYLYVTDRKNFGEVWADAILNAIEFEHLIIIISNKCLGNIHVRCDVFDEVFDNLCNLCSIKRNILSVLDVSLSNEELIISSEGEKYRMSLGSLDSYMVDKIKEFILLKIKEKCSKEINSRSVYENSRASVDVRIGDFEDEIG